MPQVITIESYQEFDERHGHNPMKVGGRFVWPDGASVASTDRDYRWEPPTDPTALLHAKRLYAQAALDKAEDTFNSARDDFAQQAALAEKYSNLPPPPASAPETLRRLAKIVERRRAELATVQHELNTVVAASPQGQARQLQQQMDRERLERTNALANEIRSISI